MKTLIFFCSDFLTEKVNFILPFGLGPDFILPFGLGPEIILPSQDFLGQVNTVSFARPLKPRMSASPVLEISTRNRDDVLWSDLGQSKGVQVLVAIYPLNWRNRIRQQGPSYPMTSEASIR
jgi:hypothetical protein